MRFHWYLLLAAAMLAWFLVYQHGKRLMADYSRMVDDLLELFTRYDFILAGVELNIPKELVTSSFWLNYDPSNLERFFFSLECVIFETNKTYDKLQSYVGFFSNKNWTRIEAMKAITHDLEDRIQTYRIQNAFGNLPQK